MKRTFSLDSIAFGAGVLSLPFGLLNWCERAKAEWGEEKIEKNGFDNHRQKKRTKKTQSSRQYGIMARSEVRLWY